MKVAKRPPLTDVERIIRLRADLRDAMYRRSLVQPGADTHSAGLRAVRDRLAAFHDTISVVVSEVDRRRCLSMHDEILAVSVKWGKDARECRALTMIIDQLTRDLGTLSDLPDEPVIPTEEDTMPATQVQSPPPLKHEIVSAASAIVMTVDDRARDCNRKWGTNRLPHLVPLDWLERFRSQKRKWEAACFECAGSPMPEDLDTVRKHGEAMLRAFDKLEDLAVAAGHLPTPPEVWEFELKDGTPVLLVRDRSEMGQADPKGRAAQIWSLEEVAEVIAKFPAIVLAKEAFPGAEVVQMRTSPIVVDELNDSLSDLPF